MRKDGKKTPKGGRTKKAAVKDLTVKDTKAVKGGFTMPSDDGGEVDGREPPPRIALNHNEVFVR
jgi:hypothetical protein